MAGQTDWVAVDWGTSNVRAWGISAGGQTVFSSSSDKGMGRIARGDYPEVLSELLADAGPVRDVIVCGMAGARQGWMEAPYLDAPADLGGLAFGAVRPDTAGQAFKVQILPGICQKAAGAEDVMRGEETQLLGLSVLLSGFEGPVCMPGTHSKWAMLEGRRLAGFSTAMTGELFEILKTHSVLRHSLAGDTEGPDREHGFARGAELGLHKPEQLSGLLFKTRAASLLSGRGPAWCAGFLSGLLIGAEMGAQRHLIARKEIPLVGNPVLCRLYASVLEQLGVRGRVIDATEVTLLGLKAVREMGGETRGGMPE